MYRFAYVLDGGETENLDLTGFGVDFDIGDMDGESVAGAAGVDRALAGDWTAGWLVFVNVDGIAPATLGVGDILLKRSEGVSGSITVITNATSSTYLEFATDGTSNMPANGIARFAICDDRGTEFGRQINVSALGRPGLSKGQTGAGITSCTAPI